MWLLLFDLGGLVDARDVRRLAVKMSALAMGVSEGGGVDVERYAYYDGTFLH